jgi:ABC-type Fe3+-hydroxamate transport system substrate-binding protein
MKLLSAGLIPMTILAGILSLSPAATDLAVAQSGKTRVLVDMTGRKVSIPDPLTGVALLGGPTGQVAYILGARSQLCAVTQSLKLSQLVQLMDPSVKDLVAPRSTSGQIKVISGHPFFSSCY